MTILTISCNSGDCNGRADGSYFTSVGTYHVAGNWVASVARVWIPFTVNLDKNTVITSAKLQVVCSTALSGNTCKCKFGCEAADNPSTPGNWATLAARTLSANYTTDNAIAAETLGTTYEWDITTAVQEILDRAGWASGNVMAVMVIDNGSTANVNRIWASSENVTYNEPRLIIEYGEAASFLPRVISFR